RQMFQHTAKIYTAFPKLVTNLSDALRAKRRLVEFQDLPKMLVDAVTAGEDQSFFSHHGLDLIRIAGAFISNLHVTNRLQGGSTITQQLARNFFLTAEPTWRRKMSEALSPLSWNCASPNNKSSRCMRMRSIWVSVAHSPFTDSVK